MNKIVAIAIAVLALQARSADDPNAVISNLVTKATQSGWTAESMAVGLDRLDRWYQVNQANQKFREELNGECLSVVTDTNALTKTFTYENGTVYIEKIPRRMPRPLEDRLTAAERKAKREAAEAKRKADRIAVLEDPEKLKAEIEALMKAKGYPEELARLLLQHELNQLKGPVIVTATITPQK